MLELGVGADILRGLSWLYLALIAFFVGISLWFPEGWWRKAIGVVASLIVFVGPVYLRDRERTLADEAHKAEYEAAKAVFQERCKTAGEKIYRTVDDVDGVLLMKVRQYDPDGFNPMMAGAAAAHEFFGDSYIRSFLLPEREIPDGKFRALAESGASSPLPGYGFVEVLDSAHQKRYRYTLGSDARLKREEAQGAPPKFGVTFDDVVDREDRRFWVASSIVKVFDTSTKEILGVLNRHVFEPGLGSRAGQRTPWLFAHGCGMTASYGQYSPRLFTDQVLRPRREISK